MSAFASQRPPVSERRFTNSAVESLITKVAGSITDPELAWLFANCLPNTLDTTIDHRVDADGRPDTYVITGDIDAMWLRDSAAQVWPYLSLARTDAPLRTLIAGVIRRQADGILLDPYANAFYRDPIQGYWKTDITQMLPGVHERKWELDSLAYFLRLSHAYWTTTGDLSPFDDTWQRAIASIFALIRVEQNVGADPTRSPYSFQRMAGTHLGSHSSTVRTPDCGLIRCSFRPSDDMVKLPFLVPANAMMAVALNDISSLLATLHLDALAAEAHTQSDTITHALEKHAVVHHPVHGEIWAYEVDGYGAVHLMDDSNVPSLLSLPYIGFCSIDDARYLRTRAFCLSTDNPSYAAGFAGQGIGSPHTGPNTIWPMSLTLQALTSRDDDEIISCLHQLKSTHAGTGFMHESFNASDASRFTRPWFAWANTLFGELIVTLHQQRPHLLSAALAEPAAVLAR
ncbi:glycoside hydrolase family 125 protein [Rariglobus hedericola]|uniref:Glycoside hydrolase family 125 protein n=1 Tax=Rariglobus hedericola TaxID=2597822 RepID=A0A556QSE5_9BACT|nr:glycoside hydrolase family 125 protein [Rariglobus hedericola]TSJ79567.1 glycoside hydrolase family 125 protein [Rariglobus hedericola]